MRKTLVLALAALMAFAPAAMADTWSAPLTVPRSTTLGRARPSSSFGSRRPRRRVAAPATTAARARSCAPSSSPTARSCSSAARSAAASTQGVQRLRLRRARQRRDGRPERAERRAAAS